MTVKIQDYNNFITIYDDIHTINETDDFYILDSIIGQKNHQLDGTNDLSQRINLNLDLETVDTIIYILLKYITGDFE